MHMESVSEEQGQAVLGSSGQCYVALKLNAWNLSGLKVLSLKVLSGSTLMHTNSILPSDVHL